MAASIAAAGGCRSDEQQQAEFRSHFVSECVQGVREQPNTPRSLDPDRVCACVADKLFAGRTNAQIAAIVEEQRGVTRATTRCAMEQLRGAGALAAGANRATTLEEAAEAAEAADE
jgi:hypothetical protein